MSKMNTSDVISKLYLSDVKTAGEGGSGKESTTTWLKHWYGETGKTLREIRDTYRILSMWWVHKRDL